MLTKASRELLNKDSSNLLVKNDVYHSDIKDKSGCAIVKSKLKMT